MVVTTALLYSFPDRPNQNNSLDVPHNKTLSCLRPIYLHKNQNYWTTQNQTFVASQIVTKISSSRIFIQNIIRYHPFSACAKFSEKLTFLPSDSQYQSGILTVWPSAAYHTYIHHANKSSPFSLHFQTHTEV